MTVVPDYTFADAPEADIVVVGAQSGRSPPYLDYLRRMTARGRLMLSVCTGVSKFAQAGILDGKLATTHWAYCSQLAALAPRAQIEPDALYVRTGRLYTSAGVTAGMDMALAMVEEDWGKTVSLAVAQELVMYLCRPGGQSQFSRHLQAEARDDRFGQLELWMLEHLDKNLSVEQLAAQANLSVRHFASPGR